MRSERAWLGKRLRALGLCMAVGALAACQSESEAKPRRGDVVARVDGRTVTKQDLDYRLASGGVRSAGALTDEAKKKLVDELITSELLAREAKARGYDELPRVKALMAGLYRADALNSDTSEAIVGAMKPIGEEEIREYWENHRAEFMAPEKLRVRRILIAFGRDKEAAKAKAEKIRGEAVARPQEFGRLALQHSDGPERRGQGELGFVTAAGRVGLDQKLVDTAMPLNVGDISPVFETDAGWNIVQVVSRSPRGDLASPRVKGAVTRRIERERRERAYADYVAALAAKADIEIDQKALAEYSGPTGREGSSQPAPGDG